MRCAKPTKKVITMVPAGELSVAHSHRCLIKHEGRMVESPVLTMVVYPGGIDIVLMKVIDPDDQAVYYIDKDGWMFSSSKVRELIRKQAVRPAR